ncbi:fluoride efflux transporter FluC [Saccharopolyspora griseoalba]|uniref:Fluoride-specific ion channel FluC n=1 Tax=Saccharopolyspora griseoalba TaxID=1431848 RepID=A0ABW2LMU5_9PSEU
MTALLVALGGAVGACLRFLTDRWVQARHDTGFPWGTLVVNATGSLLLGLLAGAGLFGIELPVLHPLVGIGLCGALTTYSTFGYESVRLIVDGARLFALLNVLGTVLVGLGAGATGLMIAAAAWS